MDPDIPTGTDGLVYTDPVEALMGAGGVIIDMALLILAVWCWHMNGMTYDFEAAQANYRGPRQWLRTPTEYRPEDWQIG